MISHEGNGTLRESGCSDGTTDADASMSRAYTHGVAQGTVLFYDTEYDTNATSAFLTCYVNELAAGLSAIKASQQGQTAVPAAHYRPGLYIGLPAGDARSRVVCGDGTSANPTPSMQVRNSVFIFASAPQSNATGASSNVARAKAPRFAPNGPRCSGYHTFAWQYHDPTGTSPTIDADEYDGATGVLW